VSLVYDDQLVVLPFRQSFLGLEVPVETPSGELADSPFASGVLNEFEAAGVACGAIDVAYVVSLSSLGIQGSVVDLSFLTGYFEPTLLVLHEPRPTFSGREAALKYSCRLTAVSLELTQVVSIVVIYVQFKSSGV
jgi:cleavage and polyadenylation specificity factor subunit 1